MKRRRTEVNDRTDGKSSSKYAKRSIEDTLSSSSAASSGDNRAPADHEGDALRINTQTSSKTDFEDDLPEDGSIPDTVPVSEQELPPSQPASPAQDNRGPRQALYMSTPWNCHICLEGFHREKERKNHCLTDKHARREAEIGDIQGKIKGPRPFKCEEHGCQKAFGRKDALMRHRREVHKIPDQSAKPRAKARAQAKGTKAGAKTTKARTRTKTERSAKNK